MAPSNNRHRRLIEDPTRNQFCTFQCDPERNPTGLCFAFCAATCPSFCHITARSTPPSSSPSPANSPYYQTMPSPTTKNNPHLSFHFNVSLISFVVVATFICTLYKYYTVRRQSMCHRTPPPESPENQETVDEDALDHPIWYIRTTGLEFSEINAITVINFKKGDGVVVGSDCLVCLNEFEVDETLRVLPKCKHGFHISCIDTWLRSHINFPLCRAAIISSVVDPPSPEENDDVLGSNEEVSLRGWIDNREEASGSSEVAIGETDEDDLDGNSEIFVEEFAASGHSGIGRFQSVDGVLEIELVKIEQRTDDNLLRLDLEGSNQNQS